MNKMIDDLKRIKLEKEISQEKMAREIGVSLQTVTRWLNGKFNPSLHVESKIAAFIAKHS